jgi:hypothetical protein
MHTLPLHPTRTQDLRSFFSYRHYAHPHRFNQIGGDVNPTEPGEMSTHSVAATST